MVGTIVLILDLRIAVQRVRNRSPQHCQIHRIFGRELATVETGEALLASQQQLVLRSEPRGAEVVQLTIQIAPLVNVQSGLTRFHRR